MIETLWVDAAVLVVASVIAVLDLEVSWRSLRLGRPLYGLLVLAGLGVLYLFAVRQGYVPLPGYIIGFFALAYLPFLSSAFIDLETTDRPSSSWIIKRAALLFPRVKWKPVAISR